jgi:hypothetical protein
MEIKEIEKICKKYGISNYTIVDGLVNVDGNVNLYNKGLTEIPLRFGRVSGDFDCSCNKLTTLKGSPLYVSGHFYCGWNNLTNLKYSPMEVCGDYYCYGNKHLKTLRGLEECFFMKEIDCFGTPVYELFSLFKNKEWSCADVNKLNDLIDDFSLEELNEWLIEEGYKPVKKLDNYGN